MHIELPPSVTDRYGKPQVVLEIAIALFQAEMFTLGQASRFADMPQREFQKVLGERKIPVHYDEEMLGQDVKTLKEFFGDRR